MNKTVSAAVYQIQAIEKLKKQNKLKKMPSNLQEIAELRLENPDATMLELGKMLKEPIRKIRSKSQTKKDNRNGRGVVMKKEIGIYIHIPFCKSKCYYCDFVSFTDKAELQNDYIEAIIKEIENAGLERYNIKTIYVGGGTPSILDSKYIKTILSKLIKDTNSKEITIEMNPGTVNEKKLKDYYNAGVNRLSIGLQSTDNKLLKKMRKNTHFRRI